VNPSNSYTRSKLATESGLKTLAGRDFTVTCLRFAAALRTQRYFRLDNVLNHYVANAVARAKSAFQAMDLSGCSSCMSAYGARGRLGHCSSPANGGAFLVVNAGSDSWTWQAGELADAVAGSMPGVGVSINRDASGAGVATKADFHLFRRLAPLHQPREETGAGSCGNERGAGEYFARREPILHGWYGCARWRASWNRAG